MEKGDKIQIELARGEDGKYEREKAENERGRSRKQNRPIRAEKTIRKGETSHKKQQEQAKTISSSISQTNTMHDTEHHHERQGDIKYLVSFDFEKHTEDESNSIVIIITKSI